MPSDCDYNRGKGRSSKSRRRDLCHRNLRQKLLVLTTFPTPSSFLHLHVYHYNFHSLVAAMPTVGELVGRFQRQATIITVSPRALLSSWDGLKPSLSSLGRWVASGAQTYASRVLKWTWIICVTCINEQHVRGYQPPYEAYRMTSCLSPPRTPLCGVEASTL